MFPIDTADPINPTLYPARAARVRETETGPVARYAILPIVNPANPSKASQSPAPPAVIISKSFSHNSTMVFNHSFFYFAKLSFSIKELNN